MKEKKIRRVSGHYAKAEFKTIGLALLLYSLLVLLLPQLLNELLYLFHLETYKGIDLCLAVDLITLVLGTLLPFFILRVASGKKLNSFVRPSAMPLRVLLEDFIVFFSIISACIFLMTALSSYFSIPGELVSGIGVTIDTSNMDNIIYLLTFIVFSPMMEEYAFRGVLLKSLGRYGKFFALLITALIYALAHGSFIEMIPSFVMSFILGKIAIRYRSILPCIYIHIAFNVSLFLTFLVPSDISFYVSIGLAVIYVTAIILMLTGNYENIRIRSSVAFSHLMVLFFDNFYVCVALAFFVIHSVLLLVL